MSPQVWLVTGATSGIGAAIVDYAISQGDKVIASGRNAQNRLGHLQSENLSGLELDISADSTEISKQVRSAWNTFGHIDILINNAGMSAMKSAEESSEEFVNNMFQVNLFGHMRVTQAMLPFFRAQGHGCMAFTSSSTAWAPLPFMAHYAASKAALSAYVEGLYKEVRPLGIRCVAFECGGFPTSLGQPREPSDAGFGSVKPSIEAYGPIFDSLMSKFATNPSAHMPGDVKKAAATVFDVVKRQGVALSKPWAVRVLLGSDAMGSAKQKCEEQLALIEILKDVSVGTDRDGADGATANKELFSFTTILE